MENGALLMALPSGRRLAYPEACSVPGKFEFTRELRYKDNARGGWTDYGAWYGTLVENAVQATARDLLAAAMLRLEAAGYTITLTVHDEIVCEVPEGFGSVEEFHRLMTERPEWAAGLPVAAKVWTRQRYAKSKGKPTAQPITIAALQPPPIELDNASPTLVDEEEEEVEIKASLADLISDPVVSGKTRCPFHNDTTPSLQIYSDRFHCYVCGAHGDPIDWLIQVEGLDRDEAVRVLETWEDRKSTRLNSSH